VISVLHPKFVFGAKIDVNTCISAKRHGSKAIR